MRLLPDVYDLTLKYVKSPLTIMIFFLTKKGVKYTGYIAQSGARCCYYTKAVNAVYASPPCLIIKFKPFRPTLIFLNILTNALQLRLDGGDSILTKGESEGKVRQ